MYPGEEKLRAPKIGEKMATRKITTFGSFRLTTEKKWSVVLLKANANYGLDRNTFL